MIGGTVIEVIDLGHKIYINTIDDRGYKCAIYVRTCDKSLSISEGDVVWWQAGHALWTPKKRNGVNVGPIDVKIERISESGVFRPDAPPQSYEYHIHATN